MERIKHISLAGKRYPLNFSVKAARTIDEKYGSLDQIAGIFGTSPAFSENLYNIHWLLRLLMEQGAAYARLVDGESIDLPSEDDLAIIVGLHNLLEVQATLLESIGFGMQTTVEVEPDPNEKTTQSD